MFNEIATRLPMPPGGIGSLHCFGTSVCPASPGGSGTLVQSVVGGLIGGATVLVGVLVAEFLARRRERADRFDDALWDLHASGKKLYEQMVQGGGSDTTTFVVDLRRLRSAARPPLPNARAIAAEVQEILDRYTAGLGARRSGQPFPATREIIGDKLAGLAKRSENWWNV
jgi:hypothetical protein